MKQILALLVCLISTAAVAANHSRWVEVKSATDFHVYVDTAEKIVDGDYAGYKALLVYPKPATAKTSNGQTVQITAEVMVVEYSCRQNVGRGAVIVLLDQLQKDWVLSDPMWANVVKPPATELLDDIKQRVCNFI